VVLSGAHTIGQARCPTFSHRFDNEESSFLRRLQENCTAGYYRQDLDVTTPDVFDNKYYHNLRAGEGVLYSDMQLLVKQTTQAYVTMFARDEWQFWNQFGNSMTKMGNLRGPQGNVGGIRQQCY
jgi:peroxidase